MIIEAVLLAALSVPRISENVSIKTEDINISVNIPKTNEDIDPEQKEIDPTPKPSRTPYPTATPKPSTTPRPTATPKPSQTPRPTRTPRPTVTPKPSPTVRPTAKATAKPTTTPNPTSAINQQSVLNALNIYRQNNGVSPLTLDFKLQSFAQSRADSLKAAGKLDNHEGFRNYIQNQNGFVNLGFNSLAENQSWNYKGNATGLIETLYGKSAGHNKNQLNSTYTHVGIGISGVYTNIVFGGKKR